MGGFLKKFERIIILGLLGMMMLAIFVSTIELGVILVQQMLKPPLLLLNIAEMLEVFGFFLMVLIGLELLESIKTYLDEDIIHVEVVMLVAIIAIARKIIILDYKKITPEMLTSTALTIIALSAGYFLVKKTVTRHTLHRMRRKAAAASKPDDEHKG